MALRKENQNRRPKAGQPEEAPRPAVDGGTSAALAHAVEYCQERNWRAAKGELKAVLEADPDNIKALHMLGRLYVQAGTDEKGIGHFERIIALQPDDAEAHNTLGMARANQGKFAEAITCYRRAIAIEPDYAEAHNNLGNVLRHLEKSDEAADCYRRVIDINPNYEMAHNNLGMALRGEGKLDEAIACFRYALEINPKFAQAHNNLGLALAGQDKAADAVSCYRHAIKLSPDSAEAYNNLGIALERENEPEEAEDVYRRAIAIDPNFAGAHNNLGNVLKDKEKLDEAAACFRRALEIAPDLAIAHNNLGIALRGQEKTEEAIACYQRALEIDPDYAEAHNNLGNIYKDQEKTEEAVACYERAIEINPNFPEAHFNRAKIHTFYRGDPALDKLKELMELDEISGDNKSHLLYSLGKAHDESGLYDEAFEFFSQANVLKAESEPYDAQKHRLGVQELRRVFREKPAVADEEPGDGGPVPIFVIGMSRSGKTLVESLLTQHGDVFGTGECHAWSESTKTVLERHAISVPYPYCMDVLDEEQIKEIGRMYMEATSKLSPESRFLVNTMPANYPYVGMIFRVLPAAKVIFCFRNPLDHCLQVFFYRYKDGNAYSYDLRNTASYYIDYHEIMALWRRLFGERILIVRYEDMVRDPVETGARIYEYCGLDFDPEIVPDSFTTDEIDHWEHHKAHLEPLGRALGPWLRNSGKLWWMAGLRPVPPNTRGTVPCPASPGPPGRRARRGLYRFLSIPAMEAHDGAVHSPRAARAAAPGRSRGSRATGNGQRDDDGQAMGNDAAVSENDDDKKKKAATVEAVREFARAGAAACETLLGIEATGADLPGGARDSLRVFFADGSVIVTRRGSLKRARLEASVLYALRAHGANVPRVLAFDGIWLIQEDLGKRRLSQVLSDADDKEGEAWLDAAVASLAQAHRAGRAAGLHQSVVTIGQKPHWLPQLLDMPVRLGTLLDLPPPPLPVAELTDLLQVGRPWFIKWDARPGNAIARDDGTVAWFDWEHSGCRNRLDDVGWLLADECTPDLPEAEERLLARHLPNFLDAGDDPEEARTYLAAFATIHSCVRLSLILTFKKDEPWWDLEMILAGDKVGVTWEACRKGLVRAARWAAKTALTEDLAPWFERLVDRLPPENEPPEPGRP